MPTKPLERLLFAQGGRCFFCDDLLGAAEASIEHVVALANGGTNGDENCVACCKSLNHLLGRMSLKEKLRVLLNQQGQFKCPNGGGGVRPVGPPDERVAAIIEDLQRRGSARPRTVKTLSGTIHALFRKQLSEVEIASTVDQLATRGVIQINATRVTYTLSPDRGLAAAAD